MRQKLLLIVMLLTPLLAGARHKMTLPQAGIVVSGKVVDNFDEPLTGVTIAVLSDTKLGAVTDINGEYSITVPDENTVLRYSYIGYETQEIKVGKNRIINVSLKEQTLGLEEVTVVAFGKQKKESVVSSIQTVNVSDLHVPSSNLTTSFSGRIAGMISYQTTGEPGSDDATFFIRGVTSFGTGKVDPLILIDNVEVTTSDLAKIHPDDIASFSILKDATATALYGARGANGVILVNTKEGREGAARVSFRVENSFSMPTSELEMSDPVLYMQLANEAVATRDPLGSRPYSDGQIDNTKRGGNPYVYPAVNWKNMLIKNIAANQRANMSISGGGKVARYYVAGSFSQDNGILKSEKNNSGGLNTNVDYKKFLLRSNVNINLTKTTEMIVRLSGTFDDNTGPLSGGSDIYKGILKASPSRFPAYYAPDEKFAKADHILFGGEFEDANWHYYNPYAEFLRGQNRKNTSTMSAQLELKKDLSSIVKGLNARAMFNTTRYGEFQNTMRYTPFFYNIGYYDRVKDVYTLSELNSETGKEYLTFAQGAKVVKSSMYGEGAVSYNNSFGEHDVSGMLVGIIREYVESKSNTLSESLPQRNLGLSGRFTYGYHQRYFVEFNFGYNGSEKFDKGHRWGFFPSIGVGWTVSNEDFWQPLKPTFSLLKIKATYGMVGNDDIGNQRFFYLSEISPTGGNTFTTGYNQSKVLSGYKVLNYANPNIGWEISYKSNLGIELGLFKDKLNLLIDIYRERRTNILQTRADVPVSLGLWSTPLVNMGEANGNGIDLSADYKHSFGKDFFLIGRFNFTYARATYRKYEEPDYVRGGLPHLSRIGQPVSQQYGYVAERLFLDQYEVEHSPKQEFSGTYMAGDIKYKDINGDGLINTFDRVPIGMPKEPEINYGFGFTAGYRIIDLSVFFSGLARSSFLIDAEKISPFNITRSDGSPYYIYENGMAQFIADDYWTEQAQNPQAAWPRLSTYLINNNMQNSTYYLRDRSFLRLKSAELGFKLNDRLAGKLKMASCRFYLSGTNLLMFSKFKPWDVELGVNGFNYPLQRVVNLGLNVSF
ncbi:MAG: TonB-dependent receptor [Tannerella sp.]|jgi:TonB-linked SusC/RagA family outer membrane protein|nr:TonB-dependent receptor [Tannerella sp.]